MALPAGRVQPRGDRGPRHRRRVGQLHHGVHHIGLSPDGYSTYFLPRLIGLRKTQELMFTDRKLSAQEAFEWGLVTKVVPDVSLLDEALRLADRFGQGSADSIACIEKLLLATFGNGLETQMEIEGRMIAECAGSRNGQEGIRAFAEKRPPRFE